MYYYSVVAYCGTKTASSNSEKIRRLAKPTVSATTTVDSVTLKWQKTKNATGYKIYRKLESKSWKKIATVKKASTVTYKDTDVKEGKKYKYQVVAYRGNFTSAKASVTATPQGSVSVKNTSAYYAVEADVKLKGSGTGYHAKMVLNPGNGSAVIFGLQYDSAAVSPYTGKTAFLCENIASNNSGGQSYVRFTDNQGNSYAELNTTYHLMMTVQEPTGKVNCYVNGVKVGSATNSGLKNTSPMYIQLEGSARKNGDKVTAIFSNISIKEENKVVSDPTISAVYKNGKGLSANTSVGKVSPSSIKLSGTLSGLSSSGDWDSEYDKVSCVVQYY